MEKAEIIQVLSLSLRGIVERMDADWDAMQEIRLRIDAPLLVVYAGREYFVDARGRMSRRLADAYHVTAAQMRETMEYISNYSMYAYEEEMRQGFVTIQGGHRVGVAGKIIWEKNRIKNMKHISFINIRLAHQVIGCADCIIPYVVQNNSIYHTLIISPPRCGKTTLLRDLIRQISNGGKEYAGMTVGVVDERSELAACYMGKPQNDLGYRTDVLDCCPKEDGMMMLVRSMSPEVIAVDEIGSCEDVEAIEYVMNCGVKLLATVHGNGIDEIKNKPILGRLVREKVFQRYILLEAGEVGRIRAVFDERGSYLAHAEDLIETQCILQGGARNVV